MNAANPKASLVITNEKAAGRLTVFNLAGKVVQRIADPAGFYGTSTSEAGWWPALARASWSGGSLVPPKAHD